MNNILTLLQLVLALLSNPLTAQNPQVQALASQAISEATAALAQEQTPLQVATSTVSYTVPTSTDNAQPIVINVTNPVVNPPVTPQNNPVLGSMQPIPETCSFTVRAAGATYDPRMGSFTWTSTNMPDSVHGQFYTQEQMGGNPPGTIVPTFIPSGNPVNASSGQTLIFGSGATWNFTMQQDQLFELILDQATCTYEFAL